VSATPWLEEAAWYRYFTSGPRHFAKRAKIWHSETYEGSPECPFYWQVKDGDKRVDSGECETKGAALAAVDRVIKAQGWGE
jgi:hypothetical protein